MLTYINYFLRIIESVKENKRGRKNVFIRVFDKIASLASTYPQVQWGIQSDVVLGKTKDIFGVFYY